MPPSEADIHSEEFVKRLFDDMAQTYGLVHLFSSLGFAYLWRRATVASLMPTAGSVCDLMAGGGECLSHVKDRFGKSSRVDLIDLSEKMCAKAERLVARRDHGSCRVINASVLSVPVEPDRYDAVVSTFGLKTLSEEERRCLAREVRRILKPGGQLSLLEFSLPPNPFVRFFFRLYVRYYVPFIGLVFLGNPDDYRMLWTYTREFENCRTMFRYLGDEGFELEYKSYFLGSATQLVGRLRR